MKPNRHFLRTTAAALLGLAAGMSLVASADGPAQPDPPVPEFIAQADVRADLHPASYVRASVGEAPVIVQAPLREPACHCAVLYSRDIESRIQGHVESWEALPRTESETRRALAQADFVPLRLTSFVEGVVGFPVRQFRLAADESGEAPSAH